VISTGRTVIEAHDHRRVGNDDGIAAALGRIFSPPLTAVTVTVPQGSSFATADKRNFNRQGLNPILPRFNLIIYCHGFITSR
jgi:hypothetical protein